LVQRYLIAAVVFVLAGVWLGVGVIKGLECLLAFLLALLVGAVVQRRQSVAERGRSQLAADSRRHDRSRRAADRPDEKPAGRSGSRSRPSHRHLYDDDADSGDWPLLAEHR
jgi:uncharacterized membrane protein YhiD involved in acid resistance